MCGTAPRTSFGSSARCLRQFLPGPRHVQTLEHRKQFDGLRFFVFLPVFLGHSDIVQEALAKQSEAISTAGDGQMGGSREGCEHCFGGYDAC